MQAWMEANDAGQPTAELSGAFAAEFGFRLSKGQIGGWRAANGRTVRPGRGGGSDRLPVGSERERKGYVYVKVAESPSAGQARDNWRPKGVVEWERANGPLPDGHVVMFADRNTRNFDPPNLVAVPIRLAAAVNKREWSDRGSLEAAVAACALGEAILDAEQRETRTCGVCGAAFTSQGMGEGARHQPPSTCPACLAAGRKAKGARRARKGPATARCAVCGTEFAKEASSQVRCRACIDERPTWDARAQSRTRDRRG